ncbi:beclin-1-like protein A isoform X1 [Maniola jurtina]|uniref:beclin-1-like protein A isoform X1 n=1 Tax=Maniola jurtina TaxID=191418 RepID=UPI001E68D8E6|nr:beclin-1-like protein A isoform X1 [Maniola jurtina]
MISSIISRLVILVFGTLYPAYASYKAVRTKNLKEYVKWMMYWIVFALFTCTETFTDVFLSWFPFYYEVKIVLVLWLLSPATKGSSILYRKFVHPALCRREQEIDEYIAKAKDQGYHTVLNLGTKGVNYATTVIMQTAIKGGGGLVQQLRKSYSLSDLSECEPREERGSDEADDVLAEPRLIRRAVKSGYATRRSASESNNRSPIYFPEVDVDVRNTRSRMDEPDFSHIKSTEDISSGYSSAENSASLTRTASVGASRSRARTTRTTVTTIKRPQAAEDDHIIIEEPQENDIFDYTNMPPLVNFTSPLLVSQTDPPFIYQYVGNQIKIIKLLSNYPQNIDFNNQNDNSDNRDQKEACEENSPSLKEINKMPNDTSKTDVNLTDKDIHTDIPVKIQSKDNDYKNITESKNTESSKDNESGISLEERCTPEIKSNSTEINDQHQSKSDDNNITEEFIDATLENNNKPETNVLYNIVNDNSESKSIDSNITEEFNDATTRDITMDISVTNDYDSAESDSEGSFGTPVSTPKSGRKANKGKYGKNKAPPPPLKPDETIPQNSNDDKAISLDNLHNLVASNEDQIQNITKSEKQEINTDSVNFTNAQGAFVIVNEMSEVCIEQKNLDPVSVNDPRQKSKSPMRHSKGSSAFGKLLQLPGKLAFWHKTDDKNTDNDNVSDASDASRKSSLENITDVFQSCSNLNLTSSNESLIQITEVLDKGDNSCGDNISNDISLKSDALQKVIDAKLEEIHPEYKFVPLHDEIPTTSKSTDV